MKKILLTFAILFWVSATYAYRYHLEMPLSQGVYMALAHVATDTNNSQRIICSRSYHVLGFPEADPKPDWGCKGLATDDPSYSNSSLSGMQSITADFLRDEGRYALYAVNSETNDVETYVDVVNWPGVDSGRYEGKLDASSIQLLGYLPAKKDLKMQVVKASQNKKYYVKMKCLIEPDDLTSVVQPYTNMLYSSFEFNDDELRWHTLTFLNSMRVSKNCSRLSLKSGGFKAKVNCKKGVVDLKGIAKQYLQDYSRVRFFLNINNYSSVETVWFDHKRKYSWHREYKPKK